MERKENKVWTGLHERRVWRFIAILLFLFQTGFLVAFLRFKIKPGGNYPVWVSIYGLSSFAFLYLIVFDPMNYWIHAGLFLIYTVIGLLWGEIILSLFFFALSCGFLFKKKFFIRNKRVKIFILIALFLVCLGIQYRFGAVHLICAIINFLAVILLVSLGYFTLQPSIQKLKSRHEEVSVLRLSADQFSERDICILRQVLRGEKYEAIAASHGIAVSTLKNNLTALYKKAGVGDRTGFLLAYANYSILMDASNNNEP